VNYFCITYARTTNFQNANRLNFNVLNNPQGKIRIDATNVGATTPLLFVHGDIPRYIPFENYNGGHSALIPNSGNGVNQSVIYIDSSLIIPVNSLAPVNGNGQFNDFSNYPG